MLLGDYVFDHEIDVDERKETEQRSLFDLFQRAMGAKKFILQTKDGNRLRQSGFYYKDRSHLLPHEDTPPGHGRTVFHLQRKLSASLRKEGLSLNVVVSNLLWFNEWHQRISSYYLHRLGSIIGENYFQPRGENF